MQAPAACNRCGRALRPSGKSHSHVTCLNWESMHPLRPLLAGKHRQRDRVAGGRGTRPTVRIDTLFSGHSLTTVRAFCSPVWALPDRRAMFILRAGCCLRCTAAESEKLFQEANYTRFKRQRSKRLVPRQNLARSAQLPASLWAAQQSTHPRGPGRHPWNVCGCRRVTNATAAKCGCA